MTPEELQALIDATVAAKVTEAEAAVKAKLASDVAAQTDESAQGGVQGSAQTGAGQAVQAKTDGADAAGADPAKPETWTREQLDAAVKAAADTAVKATVKRFEPMLIAARRPSFGAPTVIKPKTDPMPLYMAVKAAKAVPGGMIRFNLAYSGKDQELEFDGSGDAVKAFKAMLTTTGSAVGEHFIPHIQTSLVVEALYQAIISRELPGVVIYPMTSKVEDSPTIGTFSAGWATEGSALTTAGDATTGQKQLIARDLTALAKLSNNLLVDSNPSVEQYVRNGMAGAIGEAYDTGVFYGGGGTAPTGITSTAAVASTAISTDDIFTAIVKAVGRIAANKVNVKNIAVIMHPLVATKAITTRASTGGDFLGTSAAVGVPMVNTNGKDPLGDAVARRTGFHTRTMSTIPVASSTSSILVLACENLVLGDRQELEISSSNVAGSAFENNLTYIRAIMRGDVFLMRAAALEIITGVAH